MAARVSQHVIREIENAWMRVGYDDSRADEFEALGVIDVIANVGDIFRVYPTFVEQLLESSAFALDSVLDFEPQLPTPCFDHRIDFGGEDEHRHSSLMEHRDTESVGSAASNEFDAAILGDPNGVVGEHAVKVENDELDRLVESQHGAHIGGIRTLNVRVSASPAQEFQNRMDA